MHSIFELSIFLRCGWTLIRKFSYSFRDKRYKKALNLLWEDSSRFANGFLRKRLFLIESNSIMRNVFFYYPWERYRSYLSLFFSSLNILRNIIFLLLAKSCPCIPAYSAAKSKAWSIVKFGNPKFPWELLNLSQ